MQATKIAQTILIQLGGRKFIAMTGSKHFLALEKGLRFNLARNSSSANRCQIILCADDTYTVRFYRQSQNNKNPWRGSAIKEVAEFSGVYFDSLQDIFTSVTGLYTSLGTCDAQEAQ